jgi:hypothetical protein
MHEVSSIHFDSFFLQDDLCAICLDGTVMDDNEIIFCDKCSVPVHQACYHVKRIPSGHWYVVAFLDVYSKCSCLPWFGGCSDDPFRYCDVCSVGEDPSNTVCSLCNNFGGAYKPTEVPGQWAHTLCATWIPECFLAQRDKRYIHNCSAVQKSRMKLKCAICSKVGGACIQCAYGRCCVGAHPWCVLLGNGGFTRRIIKSLSSPGSFEWEIFCTMHAESVKDPIKPKVKAKRLSEPEKGVAGSGVFDNDESDSPEKVRNNKFTREKARSTNIPASSRQDGFEFFEEKGEKSADQLGGGKKSGYVPLTMSEWPGQTEGEGLDLKHFWNVVSCMYPEDFAEQV